MIDTVELSIAEVQHSSAFDENQETVTQLNTRRTNSLSTTDTRIKPCEKLMNLLFVANSIVFVGHFIF